MTLSSLVFGMESRVRLPPPVLVPPLWLNSFVALLLECRLDLGVLVSL